MATTTDLPAVDLFLTPQVMRRIDGSAKRLCRKFGLCRADCDDLRQDFHLTVLQARQNYEADQCPIDRFVLMVIIDYTPGSDVAAGDVVVLADLIGVARLDIKANKLGALAVRGVFELPKATGAGTDNDRGRVNQTMDYLRQFADAGVAVIVVSAVGRSKDGKGRSSYAGEGLNLASFRESSELEFGADDAFILHPHGDEAEGDLMKLRHLKSRHGECRDMVLRFDRRRQSFTAETPGNAATPAKAVDGGKARSALAALWKRTPAAGEGSGEHDE